MNEELISQINRTIFARIENDVAAREDSVLRGMLLYALGFDEAGELISGGKRLRPLFCCLSCAALCGKIEPALEYAAGLEMLHNFTLVHDDIEDNSDTRHNRPTLWKRSGLALALNAGDLLYEMALLSVRQADERCLKKYDGLRRIMDASSQLFLGQHRDISFEKRTDIPESEYFNMIAGKTGVLLGASFALGALAAGADKSCVDAFDKAGRLLGAAFQLRDDYLGTWGKAEILGKSVHSDIMSKKNTLAVIFCAGKDGEFRQRWADYDGNADEAEWFAVRMAEDEAPQFLQKLGRAYSEQAKAVLCPYRHVNGYQQQLDGLIESLLEREK